MNDILRLSHVTKTFASFSLQDISFTLQPGFIMGLVGPNGSGKTTTIKLIMNMLHRDQGTITVAGADNLVEETVVKHRIGYVSDELYFIEDWRPAEVCRALQLYYASFNRDRFAQYLQQFQLPQNQAVKHYSRGMKTRLMVAAALSRETQLLLLDEPTSGLDPAVRAELLDLLQDYISDGTRSVLFSTHITTDLEKIADYIVFLYQGHLMFAKNKDEVLADYRVMKGPPDQLTPEWKRQLIGVRGSAMGFEGLIQTGALAKMPMGVVVEPATLDDIIVYHAKGGVR